MKLTESDVREILHPLWESIYGQTGAINNLVCRKKQIMEAHHMITFSRSFQTSDNNVFASLELAQKHELTRLLQDTIGANDVLKPITAAEIIVGNLAKVVDILTTTATSRPKARAIHGGKKTRKTSPPNVNPEIPAKQ